MPAYNEARTFADIVRRAMKLSVRVSRELINVDDASQDATPEVLNGVVAEEGGRAAAGHIIRHRLID